MTYTTDSQLKALNIASGKKEQYIKDGSTTNLFILLRETSKTFIFRYEINGSGKPVGGIEPVNISYCIINFSTQTVLIFLKHFFLLFLFLQV